MLPALTQAEQDRYATLEWIAKLVSYPSFSDGYGGLTGAQAVQKLNATFNPIISQLRNEIATKTQRVNNLRTLTATTARQAEIERLEKEITTANALLTEKTTELAFGTRAFTLLGELGYKFGKEYSSDPAIDANRKYFNAIQLLPVNPARGGQAILAVRGTSEIPEDVLSDADPSGIGMDQIYADRLNLTVHGTINTLLNDLAQLTGQGLTVDITGHSLGGSLSQLLAIEASRRGIPIREIAVFNSPGISGRVLNSLDPSQLQRTLGRASYFQVEGDIVQMAGELHIPGYLYYLQMAEPLLLWRHNSVFLDDAGWGAGRTAISLPGRVGEPSYTKVVVERKDNTRWLSSGFFNYYGELQRDGDYVKDVLAKAALVDIARFLIAEGLNGSNEARRIGELYTAFRTSAETRIRSMFPDGRSELFTLIDQVAATLGTLPGSLAAALSLRATTEVARQTLGGPLNTLFANFPNSPARQTRLALESGLVAGEALGLLNTPEVGAFIGLGLAVALRDRQGAAEEWAKAGPDLTDFLQAALGGQPTRVAESLRWIGASLEELQTTLGLVLDRLPQLGLARQIDLSGMREGLEEGLGQLITLLKQLRTAVDLSTLRDLTYELLDDLGVPLADRNGDSVVDANDIALRLTNNNRDLQLDLRLGGVLAASNFKFENDQLAPLLGIDFQAELDGSAAYSIDLSLGLDSTLKPYLNVSQPISAQLEVGLELNSSPLSTDLGPYTLSLSNNGSGIRGNIRVDLDEGARSDDDNRLELGEELKWSSDVELASKLDLGLSALHNSPFDLSLFGSTFNDIRLPGISTNLKLESTWNAGSNKTTTNLGFYDTTIDAGSVGELLRPAVSQLESMLAPVRPVIEFLNQTPLAGFANWYATQKVLGNSLPGHEYVLELRSLKLYDILQSVLAGTSIGTGLTSFYETATGLLSLQSTLNTITGGTGTGGRLIGDLLLKDLEGLAGPQLSGSGKLPSLESLVAGWSSTLESGLAGGDGFSSFVQALAAQGKAEQTATGTIFQPGGRVEFGIPILDRPESALGLLLGLPVDLFTLDIEPVRFGWSGEMTLASIDLLTLFTGTPPIPGVRPGIGAISFGAYGNVDLKLGSTGPEFGLDTLGLQKAIRTGAFNPLDIFLNGLYATTDPIVEISAEGGLIGEVSALDLGSWGEATLGSIKMGLAGNVELGLADRDGDHRFRLSDWQTGNLLDNFAGRAGVNFVAEANLFNLAKFPVSIPLFSQTYGGSNATTTNRPPVLASLTGTGARRPLRAFSGSQAASAQVFNDSRVTAGFDGDDAIGYILENGKITVRINAWSQPDIDPATVSRVEAEGGRGNDRLYVSDDWILPANFHGDNVTDAANATAGGNDELLGGAGNDTLRGGGGQDRLDGRQGNDNLDGGAGDDTLIGGGGRNTLRGGLGADHFRLAGSGDVIADLGTGDDTVTVEAGATVSARLNTNWQAGSQSRNDGVLELTALQTADLSGIWQGSGRFVLRAGGVLGALLPGQRLTGSQINDELFGAAGNDTLDAGGGLNTMTGGDGIDRFVASAGLNRITDLGTGGADALQVSPGAQVEAEITARWAADGATRNQGQTRLRSNGFEIDLRNADLLTDGFVLDASTSTQAVSLAGSAGNDTLLGGSADDTLDGHLGNDQFLGGSGADRFLSTAGLDTVQDLGKGADGLIVSAGAAVQAIAVQAWTATAETRNDGSAIVLTSGKALDAGAATGSSGFTLQNNGGSTQLRGSSRDDLLIAGGNGDTLSGRAGSDRFQIDRGSHAITDLDQSDSLVIAAGSSVSGMVRDHWRSGAGTRNDGSVTIRTPGKNVDLSSSAGSRGYSVQNVNATAVNLRGSLNNDTLIGGSGRDTLDGGGGTDRLSGGGEVDLFIVTAGAAQVTDLGSGGADALQIAAGARAVADVVASWTADANTRNRGDAQLYSQGASIDLRLADPLSIGFRADAGPAITPVRLLGCVGDDTFWGGKGQDTLDGHLGNDLLSGNTGDDQFLITAGNDTVYDLGQGRDVLVVSAGAGVTATVARPWTATAATRNDGEASLETSGNSVDLGGATGGRGFRVRNSGGSTGIGGSALADVLIAGPVSDRLTGRGGSDRFVMAEGAHTITDLDLEDALEVSSGASLTAQVRDHWRSGAGTRNDGTVTITTAGRRVDVSNSAGSQGYRIENRGAVGTTLTGSMRDDLLIGSTGNDELIPLGGSDQASGGAGDDTGRFLWEAAAIHDSFDGNEGTDLLVMDWRDTSTDIRRSWLGFGESYRYQTYRVVAGEGNQDQYLDHFSIERFELTGGSGHDELFGAALDDILSGGAGNDRLWGYGGKASFDGGPGTDWAQASLPTTEGLNWSLELSKAINQVITLNELSSIETSWKDVEFVQLTTAAGNDSLDVRGINANGAQLNRDGWESLQTGNFFIAGAGNDTFAVDLGSTGHHVFRGEAGTDLLIMDWHAATTDIRRSWLGWAASYRYSSDLTVAGAIQAQIIDHVEVDRFQLTGGSGNDELFGGTLDDDLTGGAGNDRLWDEGGIAVFDGGAGIDWVQTRIESTPALSFSLRLATARGNSVVVNPGTDVSTSWKDIEFVHLTTTAGNDSLDARNLNVNASQLNRDGWDGIQAGNFFIAGAGNDTFAADLGSKGHHIFLAEDGTDLLVMDWGAATTDIRRSWLGSAASYRYSTDLTVNRVIQTQIIDHVGVDRFQLIGGAGNDELFGGTLDDNLSGGAGDDRLWDEGGIAVFDGGAGLDWVQTTIARTPALNFSLRLAATKGATITVNAGSDVRTSWRDIELVNLTTGNGNDSLDVRGIRANAARLNRDGWDNIHPGNVFSAGEGNDTFAVDLGSTGHHIFQAGGGSDFLIMDWRAATNDIRRYWLGTGASYRYTTDLIVNGVSQTQILDQYYADRFQLTGGAGNDELHASTDDAFDDTLIGGAGNDRLYDYQGTGIYDGGAGIDWVLTKINGSAAQPFNLSLAATQGSTIVLNAGTGVRTSWRDVECVNLTTGRGDDSLDVRGITANAADLNRDGWEGVHPGNLFNAGAGNDRFAVDLGSTGHHIFDGNEGTDLLILDWSAATADIRRSWLGSGASWRYSTDLTVAGATQAQLLDHYSVDRFRMTGGAGNDELFGGDLDDILIGNGGNDRLWGYGGIASFDGGTGLDWVLATINSTAALPFNLRLAATRGTNVVCNDGSAIQTSWKDIEVLNLTTAAGNDSLDVRGIVANGARLNRDGWEGVHPGNVFSAGGGNDSFAVDLGSTGHHIFDGNEGTDLLILDWSAATADIRRSWLGSGASWRYSTDLTVAGATQAQLLDHYGVDRFRMTGGVGNDELFGGDLDDILIGNAGNDRLWGYGGIASFDGGAGLDWALATVATTAGMNWTLDLARTIGQQVTLNNRSALQTSWKDIEVLNLTTGAGNDSLDVRGIVANGARLNRDGWEGIHPGNVFNAGAGNDSFAVDLGSTGHHIFDGNEGTDLLILDWSAATADIRRDWLGSGASWRYSTDLTVAGAIQTQILDHYSVDRFQISGGAGNDALSGGDLNDILTGNAGADVLAAGEGSDVFRYNLLSDSTRTAMDRIVDYRNGDVIAAPITAPTTIKAIRASITEATLANANDLNTALGGARFLADSIQALQLGGDTIVAINDSRAGYQSSTDFLLRLEGYLPSAASPISLQVVT